MFLILCDDSNLDVLINFVFMKKKSVFFSFGFGNLFGVGGWGELRGWVALQ